jgi:hypothetical protein
MNGCMNEWMNVGKIMATGRRKVRPLLLLRSTGSSPLQALKDIAYSISLLGGVSERSIFAPD